MKFDEALKLLMNGEVLAIRCENWINKEYFIKLNKELDLCGFIKKHGKFIEHSNTFKLNKAAYYWEWEGVTIKGIIKYPSKGSYELSKYLKEENLSNILECGNAVKNILDKIGEDLNKITHILRYFIQK